jgi:hypothetical protein
MSNELLKITQSANAQNQDLNSDILNSYAALLLVYQNELKEKTLVQMSILECLEVHMM